MRDDVLNRFIFGLAYIRVETCMVTYLIRETRPDVNGSRLAIGGGINTRLQLAVFTLEFMEIKGADLYLMFS